MMNEGETNMTHARDELIEMMRDGRAPGSIAKRFFEMLAAGQAGQYLLEDVLTDMYDLGFTDGCNAQAEHGEREF